ncbi:TlpA family protein disulfide reductase [Pedobacter metabolipauper]|nr:TlpA disulfide reductase family protein [Pedobacter metabolipauper]
MKKLIWLAALLVYSTVTQAQQKVKITGKLLNCTSRVLEILPSSEAGIFADSILVNSDGTFSYETLAINQPFKAGITNRKQIQIQIFLAPGYDIQISADVKDHTSARESIKYSGKGAAVNKYWEHLPVKGFISDTVKWQLKDEDTYARKQRERFDNRKRADEVFNGIKNDHYAAFFKQSVLIDQQYSTILNILYEYAYPNNYTPEQTDKLVNKVFPKFKWTDLNEDKNLTSGLACFVIKDTYLYSELEKDRKANRETSPTEKIIQLYKGKVLDHALTDNLKNKIPFIVKSDELDRLTGNINLISAEDKKAMLLNMVAKRKKTLFSFQIGKPAPDFNLPDTSGILHSLTSLKGKVIYIDLWASWCGPCGEENPYMNKVYQEYKNNDKIAFISIAVNDNTTRANRYKILKETKPEWLQLEDQENQVQDRYFANSIPRFIIIDKEGKMVDPDAPRPSNPEKLRAILNTQISK